MQIRLSHLFTLVGFLLALLLQQSSFAQLLRDPDINDDGVVNFVDISLFATCFATDVTLSPECTSRDFDGNGFVNFLDLTAIKDNFLVSFPTLQEAQSMYAGLRYKVSPTLQHIAVADVNLDGYPDIVGARRIDTVGNTQVDVTLLFGTQEGGYAESQTPLLNSMQAGGIETSHLNGDLYADIVVLSQNPGAFIVLMNNGAGGYLPTIDYPTEEPPLNMAVAEVTGDANTDVVIIDNSNVVIYPGLGGGAFGEPQFTELESAPKSLAVADLNGDTFNDLTLLTGFPGRVAMLYNDGNGVFDDSEIVDTTIIPETADVSDINNDGIADLIVASRFSRIAVEILFGDAQGNYTAVPRIDIDYQPLSVEFGDLNSDNFNDIVVLHRFNSAATVLLSIDGVSFEPPQVIAMPSIPVTSAVTDLDGDQTDDIVVYGTANSHLWLSRSSGDSIFNQPFSYGNGVAPGKLIAGDFDLDGNEDIVATSADFPANTLSMFPGEGSGSFGDAFFISVPNQISEIASGDFNNDGALDIIAGSDVNSGLSVLLGEGDGTFQLLPPSADDTIILSIDTLHMNGDENLDIVVDSSSGAFYALGNGDGTFSLLVSFGIFEEDPTLADINEDGVIDFVSIDPSSQNVRIRLGLGTAVFAAPVEVTSSYAANEVVVDDLDGNGTADLVIPFTENSSRGLAVLFGEGNGTFGESLRYDDVVAFIPQVADANNDGKQDIVAFTVSEIFGNGFSVFLGNGDGGLQPPALFNTRPLPRDMLVRDFDADGAPDVVTSSFLDKVIEININRGNNTR